MSEENVRTFPYAEDKARFGGDFMEWCEVFTAGNHTDSEGHTRVWSESDLDIMVNSYDQGKHEAPIVIGHPKDNAPAYGWVETLKREGSKLLAKFKQVVPAFAEAVNQGLFKKRSISVYPDGSLRHVGFLGAMPPAIKGLADFQFKDADKKTSEYSFEFIDWEAKNAARLASGKIRDAFAGKDGSYPISSPEDVRAAWHLFCHADDPDEIRDSIINIAVEKGWTGALPQTAKIYAKTKNINFKEVAHMPTVEELEAKLAAETAARKAADDRAKSLEEENKRIASEFGETKTTMKRRETEAFINEGIAAGKMLPEWKADGIVDFMLSLDGTTEISNFAEGPKKVEWFKKFISSFTEHSLFMEMSKNHRADTNKASDDDLKIAKKIAGIEEGK
jgi:hypothetical protein